MTEYITIYTDGACKGNPGPGGWAYLAVTDGDERNGELHSGGIEHTTNNAAELWAIYHAIEDAPADACILFITDSRLVIGWLQGFNGVKWRRKKAHISHPCDMIDILKEAKNIRWSFRQVKGHATNYGNNIVDQAASNEAFAVKRSR